MTNLVNDTELVRCDLAGAAARMTGTSSDKVFPFGELPEFLEEFLKMLCRPSCALVCAGLVTPEIAIAADRADVGLVEIDGESPFTIDLDLTLSSVKNTGDVIYVANPNRVTGTCLSVDDLTRLTAAVPDGFLIVDETLCDYSGVTGTDLLEEHGNVIILRSFTAPFGIHSTNAGFAMARKHLVAIMNDAIQLKSVSRGIRDAIVTAIKDGEAVGSRRQLIHDESLRLAVALTRLGIQCRISATDFLLMRVASPKDAGNFLAANRLSVENLDGYPGMRNYLRYRLSSPSQNDRLLDTFTRMPASFVKMMGFDRRAVTLHRRKASTSKPRKVQQDIHRLVVNRVKKRAASFVGADK